MPEAARRRRGRRAGSGWTSCSASVKGRGGAWTFRSGRARRKPACISRAVNAFLTLASRSLAGVGGMLHPLRRWGERMQEYDLFWLSIGFIGQALFSMRFLVQWLQSERVKRSVIPDAFWYFSVAGGVTLLAYAIHRLDPVFIVGQATGLFIYFRNLHFILKARSATVTPD